MARFLFATGIENSDPIVLGRDGRPRRVDQMESCGHYAHWREDFALVKELGLEVLRYGVPYHRVHLSPGSYDWSFSDEAFAELRRLGIKPIADLCHFGVPDWLGNFQNPAFPVHFSEYARAFALRYPWVRLYTPVNEIYIAALFSAQSGWWNERLTSDTAFVTALKHLCKAGALAMHAILSVTESPVFIQSESSEYFHAEEPCCLSTVSFLNEKRFLSLDLTYGHEVGAGMYEYLLRNGMTREEYAWFMRNTVNARCIMGNDYYSSNEHLVHADGTTAASGEIFGYYVITHQYFSRYRLPVMHTETNTMDAEKASAWLRKEWANVYRLRQDGVPIVGFTWYSLTDQMDWDTALREDKGEVNPVGLYDLSRRRRPVGETYSSLVSRWCDVLSKETSTLWPEV